MTIRKRISFITKCAVCLNFLAILIVGAFTESYSEASKRLLFFTAQSNIWVAWTFIFLVFFPLIKRDNDIWEKRIYTLKYIFTVSITLTGIVFCCFLAPFAKPSDKPWTPYGILSHVIAPALCIVDYYIDDYRYDFNLKTLLFPLIPPFAYLIFVIPLCLAGFNFGHGKPYPYFFLNFHSNTNFFSISFRSVTASGGFFWIVLLFFITVGLSAFYLITKHKRSNKKVPKI